MRALNYALLGVILAATCIIAKCHVSQRFVLWLVAYAVFAGGVHVVTSSPDGPEYRTRRLAALAAQLPATLAMAGLLPCEFGALAVVVVASQAALLLEPLAVGAWSAVQTVGVGYFVVSGCDVKGSVAELIALAGFQGFAVAWTYSARREAEARTMLSSANAELLKTRSLLEQATRAEERTRIARDLHDVLGHDLTALGLQLEIANHVEDGAARTHVAKAQEVSARLLRSVREVVGHMRGEVGPDLGAALRSLCRDVPGLIVHLEVSDDLTVDETHRAECILRCVQEIVTNTLRHARAKNLWIFVERDDEGIAVRAHDDGRGAKQLSGGHGLGGMRSRLEELGGWLEIVSAPAFALRAHLPARGEGS